MDTITIDEIRKMLEAKQRKKEYNKKYRLANKEYFARKQRELRAKRKAKKEMSGNPGQVEVSSTPAEIPAN